MRLLGLLLSVLMGICLAHFLYPLHNGLAIGSVCVSLIASAVAFYHNHASIWLWVVLGAYGWASHDIGQYTSVFEPRTCRVNVRLIDFPKPATPSGETVKAKVLHSLDCPFEVHTIIRIRAYHSPNWHINQAYHLSLTFQPSDALSLGKAGIVAYTSLVSLSPITQASAPGVTAWRASIAKRINARYDKSNQRWWQALLIGNRTALSADDWQRLRRTGTVHLLAISGLHLAIIAGMAFWALQWSWAQSRALSIRVEPRSAALIGALLIALLYSLISGAQAPVVRAWMMFAIFTLHWFYAPLRSGIQALLITAILLLLTNPFLIYSASAWLSFYATAIVILGYRRFKHYRLWRLWLSLQALITVAMWPLVWALFGGISLVSLLVNLIVVPWLGVVLMLGYVGLLWPPLAGVSDHVLTHYLNTIVFFADVEFSYITTAWQPNLWIAACACLALLIWLSDARKIGRFASVSLLLVGAMLAIIPLYPKQQSSLHVFQQSPLLAVIRHGDHTYLINAGYRVRGSDQAQTTILPYLRQRGLHPQAMIITDNSKRATTALASLLTQYPEMTLYSVVLTQTLPFEITYCPQTTSQPLVFIKARYCEAVIADQWQITRDGITHKPR